MLKSTLEEWKFGPCWRQDSYHMFRVINGQVDQYTWSRLVLGSDEVDVCMLDSDKTMWLHCYIKVYCTYQTPQHLELVSESHYEAHIHLPYRSCPRRHCRLRYRRPSSSRPTPRPAFTRSPPLAPSAILWRSSASTGSPPLGPSAVPWCSSASTGSYHAPSPTL